MKTSAQDTLAWWSQKNSTLTEQQMENLQIFFEQSANKLVNELSALSAIRKKSFGSQIALPEKYQKNANSFARSSYHILKYLKLLYGKATVNNVLLKLGIHPSFFKNLNNKISIRFLIDLLNHCHNIGFKEKHFSALSSSLFLAVDGTQLQSLFDGCRKYEDVYNAIAQSTPYFDNNFEYKFHIGGSGFELFSKPNELVLQDIQTQPGQEFLYLYRSKLFGAMPQLCKFPPIEIEVKSCISQGDRVSHYQGIFPNVSKLHFS